MPATFSVAGAPTPEPTEWRTPTGDYDIVLVAVRRDQLASARAGRPSPTTCPAMPTSGSPGVGGVMADGTADYVRIRQQPRALPQSADSRLAALESALSSRGFAIQRVADMDGWLAYRAAFIACVAAAPYCCGTDRLAEDAAVTGSAADSTADDGVTGLPDAARPACGRPGSGAAR